MLVAATARAPEAESRDPMLVAQLIAEPELVAIRPEPLGRESIAVLAQKLHGLEPDEAFCATLETATGGNPLFIGAMLDAVAREEPARPPSTCSVCCRSARRAFLAPSGFASLACPRRRSPSSAQRRSSATEPSCATRPLLPAGSR